MSGIPWTRSERANAVILRVYLGALQAQSALAVHGAAWAAQSAPCAPPAPFSKGGRQKSGGLAPRFLVKMRAGAKRAVWRGRVAAGRAALVAADLLGAVVSDGW